MRKAALYICYYNITEPLVQTQVIAYLRELVHRGFEIHLLTFEKNQLNRTQRLSIQEKLERQGIHWYALRYHGWPSLPATLYDIARGSLKALRLCATHKIRLVHARSHVGAAMALPLKWLRGARVLFDVRGLLADEYADAGHWTRGGLKYRLTKAMERVFFRKADAFIVLTRWIKTELVAREPTLRNRASDVEVIPCCVQTERFRFDPERRLASRAERGWAGKRVLVYAGKLGAWYLVDEMARFFAAARQEDSRFFFQVLTQSDPSPMRRALEAAAVQAEAYNLRFVSPDEIPRVLEAADCGISFRMPGVGARSSSPTKVAEYLAAGLPVVSTVGIGDCDEILARPNLGVLTLRLDEAEYRRAACALIALLKDPATPRVCRDFAERELSLEQVGSPRYASVYNRLLESADQDSGVRVPNG